jgi:hypothetical protein
VSKMVVCKVLYLCLFIWCFMHSTLLLRDCINTIVLLSPPLLDDTWRYEHGTKFQQSFVFESVLDFFVFQGPWGHRFQNWWGKFRHKLWQQI